MTEAAAAGNGDQRSALLDRKRLGDAAWYVLLALVLVAVFTPWFFQILGVNAGGIAWLVFGYAALYFGLTTAMERLSPVPLQRAMLGLQLLNTVFLGVLWLAIGGVQVPGFLLAFALPVLISGALLRAWEPYAVALWGIAVVSACVLGVSAEMRWYAARAGVPGSSLFRGLEGLLPAIRPFPSGDLPPAQLTVSLLLFAVLLVTVAVAIGGLADRLAELQSRLSTSRQARSEAESLAEKVLRASREPALLLHRGSWEVAMASDSFFQQLFLRPEDLPGRSLLDLVQFSLPDVVEGVLEGGEAPFVVYRVGQESRVARVSVSPLRHAGSDYVHFTLHDITQASHLRRALDALDGLYIVLDPDGRVLYFNEASRARFKDLQAWAPADAALARADLPEGWWNPGARRSVTRQVELDGTAHDVQVVTADVPGEAGRISLLTLQARARGR